MDTKKLIKDVLDAHEAGSLRHYTVAHTPGGGLSISADGAEDHARAMEALAAMQRMTPAAPSVLVAPALPVGPAKPTLMLSAAVELFLKQFGHPREWMAAVSHIDGLSPGGCAFGRKRKPCPLDLTGRPRHKRDANLSARD